MDEENSAYRNTSATEPKNGNLILVGISGAGKTSVGLSLARQAGLGFVDLDGWVCANAGKTVAEIFDESGEDAFRSLESSAIEEISNIRNHVIATGGGAVVDPENWPRLEALGTSVWIKTPAAEVARRIVMSPDEIRKRPLLADLVEIEDRDARQSELTKRIETLVEARRDLYARAQFVLEDTFTTSEASARKLLTLVLEDGEQTM